MKLSLTLWARALALAWGGFWTFFFVAESLAWHTALRAALPWVGLGLLLVCLGLIAWRWELTGALLLILVGPSIGVAYAVWGPLLPVTSRLLTIACFSGPPVVAGILFLKHRRIMAGRNP
jgi:hypothetical protein